MVPEFEDVVFALAVGANQQGVPDSVRISHRAVEGQEA